MKTADCCNVSIVVIGGIADKKVAALVSKKIANGRLGFVFYMVT